MFGAEEDNFLQRLSAMAQPSFMQPPQQASQNVMAQMGPDAGVPTQPARKRASVLDIIGGLADSVAEIGGVNPGYQPTLDARLAREREAELYPLEKRKMELGNQATTTGINAKQNEMMEAARNGLLQINEKLGHPGLMKALPVALKMFSASPEQEQAWMSAAQQDPDGFVGMLSGMGKGDAAKRGLTAVYGKDPNGNPVVYQLREDGGIELASGVRPGDTLTPGVTVVDYGDRKGIISNKSGDEIRSEGMVGGPEKGEIPIYDADNNIVGYRLAPGGKAQRTAVSEATDARNELEARVVSFSSAKDAIGRIRTGLKDMKDAGSLIDPDSKQSYGGRAAAVVQNAIPWVEAIVNEDGSTGRDAVTAAATELTRSFDAVKNEVANSGETSSSSKLMDTIKEAQANLEKTVNTRNYKSASESIAAYEKNMLALDGLLQRYLAEANAKRERLANPGAAPAASGGGAPAKPSVSNW